MSNIELTKSEKVVMEIIWGAERPIMIQEILDEVSSKYHKVWKPQTLSTFLRTLVDKGLAEYERRNMFSYYWPVMNRIEYAGLLQKKLMTDWFGGSKKVFLSTFISDNQVTVKELEAIKAEVSKK